VERRDENKLSRLPPDDARSGFTYPAIEYRHDLGKAITGGYVYRGRLIPALQGMYIFGDIVSGRIFFTDAAATGERGDGRIPRKSNSSIWGGLKTLLEILDNDSRADLRFGMDSVGEIYVSPSATG
jgi:hypothetical protein